MTLQANISRETKAANKKDIFLKFLVHKSHILLKGC